MHWNALGAGISGWLLLAAGAGKVSDWGTFGRGLGDGRVVPKALQPVVTALVPPLEILFGLGCLVQPRLYTLAPAGLLFVAFAAYQAEALARGTGADCGCYGRLRKVQAGPWSIVAYAVLAAAAVAAGFATGPDPLPLRLLGGALLAAALLIALGVRSPGAGPTGFLYAEVYYVQRRQAGENDRQARLALAQEFGLGVPSTYKLVPWHKAVRLVLRARFTQRARA